jgi:hypothetical protein
MKGVSQVEHIRHTIEERLRLGASIDEYVEQILCKAPQSFIRLVLGERQIVDEYFRLQVLSCIEELERHVSAEQLFLKLAIQPYYDGPELLRLALERHSDDLWIIELSRIVEGNDMGYLHCVHKAKDRDFVAWCLRYANQGARQGLIRMAEETGNPIPAAALWRVGAKEDGIAAALKAIEKNPNSPVLEFVSASIGPEFSELISAIRESIPEGKRGLSLQKILQCSV